jgi:hypothetical protein
VSCDVPSRNLTNLYTFFSFSASDASAVSQYLVISKSQMTHFPRSTPSCSPHTFVVRHVVLLCEQPVEKAWSASPVVRRSFASRPYLMSPTESKGFGFLVLAPTDDLPKPAGQRRYSVRDLDKAAGEVWRFWSVCLRGTGLRHSGRQEKAIIL